MQLTPPAKARTLLDQLDAVRDRVADLREDKRQELQQATDFLAIADDVDRALEILSDALFGRIGKVLEEKLTIALKEVLEQPIALKVTRDYKRGVATMGFYVERNGQAEDIMKGQGGSVANILSVGLRMFALTTLDPAEHRRFLVLDEQDCWLRPDLVPRLVKIVHDAGRALGFQVLMISHHDIQAFEQYADKIYRFIATPDGVQVEELSGHPCQPDG
jgi:hypothetical protein